jgi:hypothetical protein
MFVVNKIRIFKFVCYFYKKIIKAGAYELGFRYAFPIIRATVGSLGVFRNLGFKAIVTFLTINEMVED